MICIECGISALSLKNIHPLCWYPSSCMLIICYLLPFKCCLSIFAVALIIVAFITWNACVNRCCLLIFVVALLKVTFITLHIHALCCDLSRTWFYVFYVTVRSVRECFPTDDSCFCYIEYLDQQMLLANLCSCFADRCFYHIAFLRIFAMTYQHGFCLSCVNCAVRQRFPN